MTNYVNPFPRPGPLDSWPYLGGPQAPPAGVSSDPYNFFLRWFWYFSQPGYNLWTSSDWEGVERDIQNFRSLVVSAYQNASPEAQRRAFELLRNGGDIFQLLEILGIDESLVPGRFLNVRFIPPNSDAFLQPPPEYNLATQPASVPGWLPDRFPGRGSQPPSWYTNLFNSIENQIGRAQLNDAVYRLMSVWLHTYWNQTDVPDFWEWARQQGYDRLLSSLAQQIRAYRPRTSLQDINSPPGQNGTSPLFPGIPSYGGLPFRVVPFEYATEVQDTPLNYEFGGQVAHLLYGSPMTQETKAAAARLMPLLEDRWKREAIWQGRGIQFWDWLEEQGWDRLLSRYNPEAVYGDWLSRSSGLTPEMRRTLSLAQDRSVDTWRNYGAGSPFGEWLSRQRQSDLAQLAGPAELGRSAGRSRWVTY